MTERMVQSAVGQDRGEALTSPVEGLSDRELQVFQFIGEGLNTREIARRMHASPKTVETYRARIKKKLRLNRGNELVHRAVQWVLENI